MIHFNSVALVFDIVYCHSLVDCETMCALVVVVVIANGTAVFVLCVLAVVKLSKFRHATNVCFDMVFDKYPAIVMETK